MRKILLTFLSALLVSITALGATYTWDFSAESTKSFSDGGTNNFTSTSGDKTITYYSSSSEGIIDATPNYLKVNGASQYSSNLLSKRYFKFKAPSANGTITFNYAGTASGLALIYTSNGDYTNLTQTASKSVTSTSLNGLTAGTTDIYISFTAKPYIYSITWTETDAPAAMTSLYESDIMSTMESGASAAYSASLAQQTGGSGWVSAYSKYMKASSTNQTATITFTSPLALVSDGNDRGKIRIYYASTGHSANTTVISEFKINGGSNIGTYGVSQKEKIHIIDYTIPDATETLSSVYAKVAVSNGCLLHIEVLTHSGGECSVSSAEAGANKVTTANSGVALAATAAGSGKTGTWSITSKPDGSSASASSFSSVNSATATFTPDKVGNYTLTWTVECDEDDTETASDNMTVTANCIAISPSLSYASVGGTTLDVGDSSSGSPTVSGNTGSGTVSYEVTSASPAGCLTVNPSTGIVSAIAAGSATVTATIVASGNYCGNTATANFTIADDCTDPGLTITLN